MKMNELRQNSRSVNRSHLINGKVSRFVNLYLLNFDSGAESGGVFQPRATPWVSTSDGCALQGRRNPPPSQGRRCAPTRTRGVAPGWYATRRCRVTAASSQMEESAAWEYNWRLQQS